jgi:cytochrome c oxidase subunit I
MSLDPQSSFAKRRRLARGLLSTNHRTIGKLYLAAGAFVAITLLLVGVSQQAVLGAPGAQFMCQQLAMGSATPDSCAPSGQIWNLARHSGPVLLFLTGVPLVLGLGNHALPARIGARDMALPPVNAALFWAFAVALLILASAVLAPEFWGRSGPNPGVGWVLYPGFSVPAAQPGIDAAVFAIRFAQVALMLAALNLIATFLVQRAPDMALRKVPLVGWAIVLAAGLVLLSLPRLSGAATMILTDRNFGTVFPDPAFLDTASPVNP